jgi:hypothetical protein
VINTYFQQSTHVTMNDVSLQMVSFIERHITMDFTVVQIDLYKTREHDEQWGGEHLGNQHADIQQAYHDTVRVMLSPSRTCTDNGPRSLLSFPRTT